MSQFQFYHFKHNFNYSRKNNWNTHTKIQYQTSTLNRRIIKCVLHKISDKHCKYVNQIPKHQLTIIITNFVHTYVTHHYWIFKCKRKNNYLSHRIRNLSTTCLYFQTENSSIFKKVHHQVNGYKFIFLHSMETLMLLFIFIAIKFDFLPSSCVNFHWIAHTLINLLIFPNNSIENLTLKWIFSRITFIEQYNHYCFYKKNLFQAEIYIEAATRLLEYR